MSIVDSRVKGTYYFSST